MKLIALAAVSALLLAGCAASTPAANHRIAIVASTDVYGSIASAVGGSAVTVTSIMNDPAQDPHSFEANARVQLELSKADLVIENGAGYDDFVDTMLSGLDGAKRTVLNVATISGKTITPDFNEHLWYDFPTIENLVAELVTALSKASPADASTFEVNAEDFVERLNGLERREATIQQTYGGSPVAITEPVPAYLLVASGLKIITPKEFSKAIEDSTDVSPAVLKETLTQFTDRKVKALVYNDQTAGPQTTAVLKAADESGIPVVPVTETLPQGLDYLGWMTLNLRAIERALK
ncbi:MAG: zinc ABC transporter substrate-binding protein [Rhodoglobus sp.]